MAKITKAQNPEKALSEIRRIVEARHRIAMAVFNAQDSLTQEVLERIRDRLRIAATGVIQINGKPVKIEQKLIDFNLLFIATEILSDLALNDIQIANFEYHPAYCAECKEEIAGVAKPRKKVRR